MIEKTDFSADNKKRATERAERDARFQKEMEEGMKKDDGRRHAMMAEHETKLANTQSARHQEKDASDAADREKIRAAQEKIRDIERRLES